MFMVGRGPTSWHLLWIFKTSNIYWVHHSLGICCMAIFAALPSTIMEAAFGTEGAHHTVVESIMVDGNVVKIAIQQIPNE